VQQLVERCLEWLVHQQPGQCSSTTTVSGPTELALSLWMAARCSSETAEGTDPQWGCRISRWT
jgi:hypothetical protein